MNNTVVLMAAALKKYTHTWKRKYLETYSNDYKLWITDRIINVAKYVCVSTNNPSPLFWNGMEYMAKPCQ